MELLQQFLPMGYRLWLFLFVYNFEDNYERVS